MRSGIVYCPQCRLPIQLYPINCKIIRCGGYWSNNQFIQFPQHASKQQIDTLKKNKHIGCGSPLKLIGIKLELGNWGM